MSRSRLVLALVFLGATLALVPPASAAKRPPNRAKLAQGAAKRLLAAKTDRARRKAVLGALRTLGVGVYTGRGRAIQRGAERRARDTFLYDFEVAGLVAELRRGRRFGFGDVVAHLRRVGLRRRSGKELTAARLAKATATAIKRARRHPTRARGGSALLVAAIARGRHTTLSSRSKLDALQAWAIEADVIAGARRTGKAAWARRASAAAAKPCFSGQARVQKALKGLGVISDAVGDVTKLAVNVVAQPLHMASMSLAIEVTAPAADQVTSTHYGPVGHGGLSTAGRKLVFTVEVRMLAEPPELAIRCGPLAGLKLPHKGPIARIPINWDGLYSDGIATLERHGMIVQKDEQTGADGSASLVFDPRDEVIPTVGKTVSDADALGPEAEVFSGLGNDLGNLPEAIGVKAVFIGFSIARHAPRGFKFDVMHDFSFTGSDGVRHARWHHWTGRICGEDPFARAWQGNETSYHDAYTADGPQQGHAIAWTLVPGKATRSTFFHEAWAPPPAIYWYDLRLEPAARRMAITTNASENDEPTTRYGALAEDTSCPAPR